jgi:uncharacterized SAM-dependent methyltransferase
VNGTSPKPGEIFKNPDLARTFRLLQVQGVEAFYRGVIAKAIVAKSTALGGTMTLEDLAHYHGEWVEAARTRYHDYELLELPPPAQAWAANEMLNILQACVQKWAPGKTLASLGPTSALYWHLLVEAKKLAYADLYRYNADPNFAAVPLARLLSESYATSLCAKVDPAHASKPGPAGNFSMGGDTIVLSTADDQGNMVSWVNSNFEEFGSGITVPGFGFILHDRGALFTLDPKSPNVIQPHKRPFNTLSAGFLLHAKVPVMTVTLMGGDMQAQGHAQLLVNILDLGDRYAMGQHGVVFWYEPFSDFRTALLIIASYRSRYRLLNEILLGLTGEKKTLPSKLLYDATGSELFQRITELPEYYLTRTEKKLLGAHAADIVPRCLLRPVAGAHWWNSGPATRVKRSRCSMPRRVIFQRILQLTFLQRTRTHPHAHAGESSPNQGGNIASRLFAALGDAGTFSEMHMVGFLPGSTVGQFSPATVVQFLENVRRALTGAARPAFVIGTDQCRDAGRVLSAYDDSAGISRAFNLNILSHINRLADCDLDLNSFGRKVLWNPCEERVEMYLESRSAQSARIAGRSIRFAEGETIQIGISYKYGKERFLSIAAAAGWSSAGFWQDSEKLFGIHLLQARPGEP